MSVLETVATRYNIMGSILLQILTIFKTKDSISLVIGVFVMIKKRYDRADSILSVKIEELQFNKPQPTIIGRGTFRPVLLAQYRSTKVAMERVIPAKDHASMHLQDRFNPGTSSSSLKLEDHAIIIAELICCWRYIPFEGVCQREGWISFWSCCCKYSWFQES